MCVRNLLIIAAINFAPRSATCNTEKSSPSREKYGLQSNSGVQCNYRTSYIHIFSSEYWTDYLVACNQDPAVSVCIIYFPPMWTYLLVFPFYTFRHFRFPSSAILFFLIRLLFFLFPFVLFFLSFSSFNFVKCSFILLFSSFLDYFVLFLHSFLHLFSPYSYLFSLHFLKFFFNWLIIVFSFF